MELSKSNERWSAPPTGGDFNAMYTMRGLELHRPRIRRSTRPRRWFLSNSKHSWSSCTISVNFLWEIYTRSLYPLHSSIRIQQGFEFFSMRMSWLTSRFNLKNKIRNPSISENLLLYLRYLLFYLFISFYIYIHARLSKENIVTRVARMQRSRQFQGLSRMEKCNA